MIKANELRIGNYFIAEGVVRKLFGWMDGDMVNYTDLFQKTTYYCSEIEPIPLTPEILKKCGFYESNDWLKFDVPSSMSQPFFLTTFLKNNEIAFHYGQFGSAGIKIPIKHLHQLQNLYFTLRGEELPVINLVPEDYSPVNVGT